MMSQHRIKLGLTPPSDCVYLPNEIETIAVVLEPSFNCGQGYAQLIDVGFRRSGDMIYRPQCPHCRGCQSLRVDTLAFSASKSQKRQLKQLEKLTFTLSPALDPTWFDLYQRYINARHRKGTMFPPDKANFESFIRSSWQSTEFLHLYQNDQLIAVAVTDVLPQGLSALYSFFDPDHPWSLGSICILAQIAFAKEQQLPWLYLGFQIHGCIAMSYKEKFRPHQRYIDGGWIDFW